MSYQYSDGYLYRRMSAGKYDGPDPEAVRILMAAIRHLEGVLGRETTTTDRLGNELVDLRCKLGRAVEGLGVSSEDMDEDEMIFELTRRIVPSFVAE